MPICTCWGTTPSLRRELGWDKECSVKLKRWQLVKQSNSCFSKKEQQCLFIWGVAKLTPEVEKRSGGEVSRKIYRVCKAVLSESSTVPLHLLMEERFQQHRKRKCHCELGLIYFPFRTLGDRQMLICRWHGQLTRSGSCYRGAFIIHIPRKPRKKFWGSNRIVHVLLK